MLKGTRLFSQRAPPPPTRTPELMEESERGKRSGRDCGWREQNFPWCFWETRQSQTPPITSPSPQQWAHDPSWPRRRSHPLGHSDWVKRGHVTSAGPIRNSRVTETLQRVFLGPWGWGLRRESSGMPEVESVAAGSGPPGLPWPVCHFPKREARSVLLGPLTCEVGPMTASPLPSGTPKMPPVTVTDAE